jgi:hypothetical protein
VKRSGYGGRGGDKVLEGGEMGEREIEDGLEVEFVFFSDLG